MPEPANAMPPTSKAQVFLRRAGSTLLLWTAVIGAMFSGNRILSDGVCGVFIAALAIIGLLEFYGLAQNCRLACFKFSGLVAGVLLVVGTFAHFQGWLGIHDTPARVNDFETGLLIVFVLGLCVRQFLAKENTNGITAIAVTLFGLMYVPWLLNFIQKIYFFPGLDDEGKYYVLYFLLVTKFSDMGAYMVGSLIGRHKMIPRISPGKTWEGFGGAIVISTAGSLAYAHIFSAHMKGMNATHAIILGVILSIAAVIGDLIESLFKREAGAKDSGKLFPGIGGILDLVDSLLFNAPLMYLYLRHILTHP
jgi:phosphatidate cytidylyltransferase